MPQHPNNVLLVEDNPGDVELTRMAFAEAGVPANLHVVQDGVEALAYLYRQACFGRAARPDLVLLDLNLPRKDGREVLADVKANVALRSIPVVVLSTSDADVNVIKSYALGANSYLVKPVEYGDFVQTVRDLSGYWFRRARLPCQRLASSSVATLSPSPPLANTRPEPEVVHCLVVEDNPGDAELLAIALQDLTAPSFEVSSAACLHDAMAAARQRACDVVLLDLGLPDSQGLVTFTHFQQALPHLPVVVWSGTDDTTVAVQAVRDGAQDYLVKGHGADTDIGTALCRAIERKWYSEERASLAGREKVARQEAENAVLARDEFISVASHELKTPITTMTLQVEQMRRSLERVRGDDALCDRTARMIGWTDRIHGQTTRLNRLVEHLLDVSHINSGRLKLETGPMDLAVLVREVMGLLDSYGRERGCRLTLRSSGCTTGEWDRFRMEQVLVNLLTNALKYGRGHPVDVELRGATEDDPAVTLIVRDHGIGIAAADQSRIFRRFERAVRAHSFEGLGLGLFIVRQIVDAHRGTIRVASQPGRGAAFIIELPT